MVHSRGLGEDGRSLRRGQRARQLRRSIGNYELLGLLGRGGFSRVYLARHRILSNRPPVALKRLLTPLESQEAYAQFLEEARLLEQLHHEHILPLIDAGVDEEGCPYLVTARAGGGSLRERLHRADGGPLPLEEVLAIIAQIGEALQYAHERGVIHRDLKPENILFTEHGEALLSDFGIALLLGSQSVEQATASGTPAYMAPEQFRGQISRQSDQYALACVAYELCTGRRVFEERDPLVLMYKHTQEEPEPPRCYNLHLPPGVEAAILRGLAKERGARYPDVQSFVAALHAGVGAAAPVDAVEEVATPPTRPLESRRSAAEEVVGSPDPPIIQFSRGRRVSARRPLAAPVPRATDEPPRSPAGRGGAAPSLLLGTQQGGRGRLSRRRQRLMRWLPPLVLLLLLVGGLIMAAYADPAVLGPLASALPFGAPLALVRITPASADLQNQYLITGVTGVADPARREVPARLLSATAQSPSKTVAATGHAQTAGTQAHGTITFSHASGNWETVVAGSTFFNVRGTLSVSVDSTVTLPPADPQHPVSRTVGATVLQPGSVGNLPAGIIKEWYTSTMYAVSGPFTGGQDPQNYIYVQRSDIDDVANPLKAGLLQQARQRFLGQVHSGERLIGPDCSTGVRSDHQVGDHASSVTLTVTATCTGEAYDEQAALRLGDSLLSQEAAKNPGAGYALVGQIVTTISGSAISDARTGRLAITVAVHGIWIYQFTDARRQSLVRLIAGRSEAEARRLLLAQTGVSAAEIQLVRSGGALLPSNPGQITLTLVAPSVRRS